MVSKTDLPTKPESADSDYNIFIAWSGKTSLEVAKVLYENLPLTNSYVRPWLSQEEIPAGALWDRILSEQLSTQSVGIICVTPDNLDSPWLHFEAGALSKAVGQSYACPYLFQVPRESLAQPLARLQFVESTKAGTWKLVSDISRAIGGKVRDEQLQRSFEKFWPDIEVGLSRIRTTSPPEPRKSSEILGEILGLVREIERRTSGNLLRLQDVLRQATLSDFLGASPFAVRKGFVAALNSMPNTLKALTEARPTSEEGDQDEKPKKK